jgi:DNA polymerase III alpha subunit
MKALLRPVLVRNRTGYQNLCRLITLMKLRVPKHAKPANVWSLLTSSPHTQRADLFDRQL